MLEAVWRSRARLRSTAGKLLMRLAEHYEDDVIRGALLAERAAAFLVLFLWRYPGESVPLRALQSMFSCPAHSATVLGAMAAAGGVPAMLMTAVGMVADDSEDGRDAALALLTQMVDQPGSGSSLAMLAQMGVGPVLVLLVRQWAAEAQQAPPPDSEAREFSEAVEGRAVVAAPHPAVAELRRLVQTILDSGWGGQTAAGCRPQAGGHSVNQGAATQRVLRERQRVLDGVRGMESALGRSEGLPGQSTRQACAQACEFLLQAEQAARLQRRSTSLTGEPGKAADLVWALQLAQHGCAPARCRVLGMLHNMALGCSETAAQLCKAGAVEVLAGRLVLPPSEGRELRAVVGALRALARGGDACRLQMARRGVPALLRPLLHSERRTREAVVRTLRVLARQPLAAQALLNGLPVPVARELGVLYSQVTVARCLPRTVIKTAA